jgi:hypothetical protein
MMKRGHHWRLVALLGVVLIIYLGHSGVRAQPALEPIPTVERPGQTDTSLPVRGGSSVDLPTAEQRPDPHTDIRVDRPGILTVTTDGEPEVVGPSPHKIAFVDTIHVVDTLMPFNTVVPEHRLLDTIDHGDTIGLYHTVVPGRLLDSLGEPEIVGPSPNTITTFPTFDTLPPGYDTTNTFPTHNPVPTLDTLVPFNTVVPEHRLLDTIDHGDTIGLYHTVVPTVLLYTTGVIHTLDTLGLRRTVPGTDKPVTIPTITPTRIQTFSTGQAPDTHLKELHIQQQQLQQHQQFQHKAQPRHPR